MRAARAGGEARFGKCAAFSQKATGRVRKTEG